MVRLLRRVRHFLSRQHLREHFTLWRIIEWQRPSSVRGEAICSCGRRFARWPERKHEDELYGGGDP
jgi:hypothetical protein